MKISPDIYENLTLSIKSRLNSVIGNNGDNVK